MLMPVIGWAIGLSLQGLISGIDHWIAFGLLAFIGAKMIYEALKNNGEEKTEKTLKLHTLLILAVATSIDALMVGLSFAFLQTSILLPIAVIGIVTLGCPLSVSTLAVIRQKVWAPNRNHWRISLDCYWVKDFA